MNTTMSLLITRPNHDIITTYLFSWSDLIIQEARKKGIRILDLSKRKANQKNFVSYIKEHQPILVVFNGHGNKYSITGYNNEVIVDTHTSQLLKNKIIYARSCDAANDLGKICIENGTLSFIGYKRKYVLIYTLNKFAHPLLDNVGRLFIEPSNLLPISLLKGNMVIESYKKSQNAMARNIRFMLSTKADQLQKDAAPFLWSNKQNQIVLGNHNAKIK